MIDSARCEPIDSVEGTGLMCLPPPPHHPPNPLTNVSESYGSCIIEHGECCQRNAKARVRTHTYTQGR